MRHGRPSAAPGAAPDASTDAGAPGGSPWLSRRRGYHHGNLSEALIEAARRLIADHGPAGFTLKDAARLAGVSPAAPYRHFRDRAALIAAVSDRGFELFAERLRAAARAATDPAEAFSRLGEAYLAFAAEEPGYYAAMFDAGEAAHAENDAGAGAFRILVDGLVKAYGADAFGGTDPRLVALQVWALSHGVATLSAAGRMPHGPGVPTAAEVLSRGVDALVRGACGGTSPASTVEHDRAG